jgi:hypothetical protein
MVCPWHLTENQNICAGKKKPEHTAMLKQSVLLDLVLEPVNLLQFILILSNHYSPIFYILLTVHHVMILGKWPTWRTILYYVFIFISIFNSLHVSCTSCSLSGETNCVNTTSDNSYSVSVAVSCAGRKFTSNLHTTRPPTQSDSYQRLCCHKLSLLTMSTMCSKRVES